MNARRQEHNKNTRKVVFNISLSFQVENVLGEGAYGIVCSARHKATGIEVAIKKIEPFDKPLCCLRTLREIALLQKFKGHENIILLFDVQKPANFERFNEVYLIQEYMSSDLSKVIHDHMLTDEHCQYFTYQILRGLKMVHSANVIHRDLKPSNILVSDNCDVKICDFGLARLDVPKQSDGSPDKIAAAGVSALTEYVATRWYRAPEIMLNASQYSTSIDVWLVGCILAEMLIYIPLFPGSDYRNQITLILGMIGTPSDSDLQSIRLTRARRYIQGLPRHEALPFGPCIQQHPERHRRVGDYPVNPLAIDLLEKLLVFNPANRITVEDALAHPYLAQYHDATDEPTTTPMRPEEFDYDVPKGQLDASVLKRQMYDKIMSLNR